MADQSRFSTAYSDVASAISPENPHLNVKAVAVWLTTTLDIFLHKENNTAEVLMRPFESFTLPWRCLHGLTVGCRNVVFSFAGDEVPHAVSDHRTYGSDSLPAACWVESLPDQTGLWWNPLSGPNCDPAYSGTPQWRLCRFFFFFRF